MIEWLILFFSFTTLYLGIFWLHVVSLKEEEKEKTVPFSVPFVSLIVPARNEEKGLFKTLHSLISLDYPKEKLEILVVDHESSDRTPEIAKHLIAQHPHMRIRLLYKKHLAGELKADSFNEGLRNATGEFVGCVDADTVVMQNCLQEMIPLFQDPTVGAVISTIKVHQPKNLFERIQHLEYIFATFTRGLMSRIDTLHVTPGALSIYRKSLFDKYGPFDTHNITEDLEMAMRLRSHGYKIKLAEKSVTYTKVPDTFQEHWKQRVRWFRGFIYNTLKYRKMVFNKDYDLVGTFQYPVNVLSIVTILTMFFLTGYELLRRILTQITKFNTLGMEYFHFDFTTLPTLKHIILSVNIVILFPIIISFFLALVFYHLAHKNLKEKWKYPFALLSYLTVYPALRSMQWMTAFYKETFRTKNKWK